MKLALDKIVFLPWGKLVDQWRWKVFTGEIKPEQLQRRLVEAARAVPGRDARRWRAARRISIRAPSTTCRATRPYTRYFLSFILQFQFQKALCDTAGPHRARCTSATSTATRRPARSSWRCSRTAQSQPWPETLEKLTGSKQMDAGAIIDYFAPLMAYLKEQNKGQDLRLGALRKGTGSATRLGRLKSPPGSITKRSGTLLVPLLFQQRVENGLFSPQADRENLGRWTSAPSSLNARCSRS